ncbi:methyltransferase [Fodinicola acaciae]|uniref:methyltransferase n=1 Tax=Fodinicola acaciae TaxID=2681555 RepID=UPI0013D74446|nr:methyltransferase [Fodinicola acaciae]
MTTTIPGKTELIRLGLDHCRSKVLLTAVELGIFTHLAAAPATETELRAALDLHPRATRDFLDALVAMDLLDREQGFYRNTAVSDAYLDARKPGYVGGFLIMHNLQYGKWARLAELLQIGSVTEDVENEQKMHDDMQADPKRIRRFMAAMDGINQLVGPALADKYDWRAHRSFADLGGARGNLSAELVKAHPHLNATVFDLPAVREVFDEHMEKLGMAGRIAFHPGDFFTEPVPSADVLIFGHVLHDWNPGLRKELVRKAYDALPSGGVLLVYDPMIDDERRTNDHSLITSLHMMLISPGGSEYTAADCRAMMVEAGFTETDTTQLTDVDTLVIGRKK